MINAFTIDLEDWYHGMELPQSSWGGLERRIEHGFYTILELLQKHRVKATFFTLGLVAKEHPHLVRELAAGQHELASHGYSHDKVYNLTPRQFREDVRKTKKLIEDITSKEVSLYRAPFFTITRRSLWALEILAEEGYKVDCSISPFKTWRYGIVSCPDKIFRIPEAGITEFPVSSFKFLNKKWAVGGAFFRLLPFKVTSRGISSRGKENQNTMFYIHPWEYDPAHPVMRIDRRAQFMHYTRLNRTTPYTEKLLSSFKFDTVTNVIKNYQERHDIGNISIDVLQGPATGL